MDQATAEPKPTAAGPPLAPRRKGPPAWGIVLFLALLGGLLILNQRASTGGPPIAWIDGDLEAALRLAAERNYRVFLYLYEPNDPVHLRNERELFSQRWAREPLQKAVCCRIAVGAGDLRRVQYNYTGSPLFLLLNAKGKEMTRTEGAVDEREFLTHIGRPAEDYARKHSQ